MSKAFWVVIPFLFCLFGGAKTVRIQPGKPLQEQFQQGAVTYLISGDLNLMGETIFIPDNALLKFCGGTVKNGVLSGTFQTEGIKRGSFQVRLKKGSALLCDLPVYNYSPEINASVLSACVGGITLMEDVEISSDVSLRCSIDGKGHVLSAFPSVAVVFRINSNRSGISISNIRIHRQYDGRINTNYAIYCENSSNVFIQNSSIEGRLYFVNRTSSDRPSEVSSCFFIKNCTLTCDLSSCPQGWEYGQDHISFYSIKDVSIENCHIYSTNVNRVVKTSQYFSDQRFVNVSYCTENVLFRNNIVQASSNYGKQLWDMFCGSTNITITDNSFELKGFSRFIENKAFQDKYNDGVLVLSSIKIANNNVITSGSDLFQFRTSPNCDSIEVTGNKFIMGGPNINPCTGFERSCGMYLQGYRQMILADNVFEWKDEACGILFAKMNFSCEKTEINNNSLTDVYRINMTSATHPVYGKRVVSGDSFVYQGNLKSYSSAYSRSREELYVSETDIKDMEVNINSNSFDGSYEIVFAKDVKLNRFVYGSTAKDSKSYYYQSKARPWKLFRRNED